jgi:hypothetical protein
MTNSKKSQIAIVLVLTCNFVLWSAEEPNDPNRPQIKIEISDQEMRWARTSAIRPTHVAEVFIRRSSSGPGLSVRQETLLETSSAAAMTPKQREFMEASTVVESQGSGVANHHRIFLYAVSEADAKKMVEAFIEILDGRAGQKRLQYVNKLREDKEEMAKAKGLLPGKEALLPSVKTEYDKIKESSHPFTADTEAAEHAKQTMLEMGKMLDALDVELAGIREKLKVIQEYWNQDGEWTKEALAKLQELQIIQTIELKGAEARKKAAVAIRQREKDFLDLFEKWTSLESEIDSLKSTILSREERITKCEETLANPKLDMLPPKIYENKVVIYPVAEQKDTPEEE